MIDPDNITNYERTRNEKEGFLLFCAVVAGKNAHQQAKKLDTFLMELREAYIADFHSHPMFDINITVFGLIKSVHEQYLLELLQEVKMGQYTRLTKAFKMLAELDVDTCTVEDLEAIPGIGPKTARFFIVHSRKDQNHAVLDTHILSHLRDLGYDAPKSTPSRKRYSELEGLALSLARESGMTPADWDLMVWKTKRKKNE